MPSSSPSTNKYVFHHRNNLRHLSDAEKELIVQDMEQNWREHFPNLSSYTQKMNQLYDISIAEEYVKAERILNLEERHYAEYPIVYVHYGL